MAKKRNELDVLSIMPHEIELDGVSQQIIDEYFGIWAIEEMRFRQAVEQVQGMNLHAHVQANVDHDHTRPKAKSGDRRLYNVAGDGVAVVSLRGPMMKQVASMSGGASTVFARRQIRQAVNDPEVGSILLVVDSPGGTVAGTMDLAEEVARANEKKPVYAFTEDLTASAAVWVASQARKIYANNATALYGSIGTFAVLYDASAAAEKLGIKVHVIRAGKFKGAATPGTAITDEVVADIQRIIDATNEEFLQGVSRGRGMSIDEVRTFADGRIHLAAQAVDMKLIDGVQSIDRTISDLSRYSITKRRTLSMSKDTGRPENAATLEDLRSVIPDASADFVLQQYDKAATAQQAMAAYAAKLKADNDAMQKQLADTEAKHKQEIEDAKKSTVKVGVQPLGSEASKLKGDHDGYIGATGDPVADFDAVVRARMQANPNLSRQRCVLAVSRANPELHQAYLLATNPGRRVGRMLQEKYEDEAASAN